MFVVDSLKMKVLVPAVCNTTLKLTLIVLVFWKSPCQVTVSLFTLKAPLPFVFSLKITPGGNVKLTLEV